MMRKPQFGKWIVLLVKGRGGTNVLLLSGRDERMLHSLARFLRTCYRWPKRAYARWKAVPVGNLQSIDQVVTLSAGGSSFDMTPAFVGISIGIAGDLALTRSLGGYVPAQRAMRVNPVLVLRHE